MRPWIVLCLLLTACSSHTIVTSIENQNTQELPGPDTWVRSCTADDDCTLVNRAYGYSCCYAGRCDALDYSRSTWIAVNEEWLSAEQGKFCQAQCGPAPGCPTSVVNDQFAAACQAGTCEKVALE